MTLPKSLCLPLALLLAMSSLALPNRARAASPSAPDFGGIWRLNDQQSGSSFDIAARLRMERTREQPVQLPASASSTGTPAASEASGGHAGGHGMGDGGMVGVSHGHGGSR
ncbi:MAG: hypothetical protein ABI227_10300 [Rhodanobacter sp.]